VKGRREGRGSGRLGIEGEASGFIGFAITGRNGQVIKYLANQRDAKAFGTALKPHAHMYSAILWLIARHMERRRGDQAPLIDLLRTIACLLLALPRPVRGRPRKPSTNPTLDLAARVSVRKAVRLTAKETGENPENIRARYYGIKRRAKKGGNKFK